MKIKIGEQEFEPSQVIEALQQTQQYEVFTPQEISQKFGSLHQGYEQLIEEAFGVQKNQGEKGIDFVRRAAAKVKEDFTSTSSKVSELEELKSSLESKLKTGSNNEAIKKQNEELIGKIESLTAQIQEEKSNFEKELSLRDSKDIVRGVLSGIKSNLKKEADKYGVQYVEEKVFSEALKYGVKKDEKGNVILLNESGVARLNDDMTPVTLNSLAGQMFEPYIEKKKVATGTGATGTGATQSPQIPSNIKSRVELDKWVNSKESNIQMYSKEWVDIRKAGESLPME